MRYQLCSGLARRAASASAAAMARGAPLAGMNRPLLLLRPLTSAPAGASDYLVVNAVGKDRTGIVSEMTKFVTDAGGNVGDSQAAKLGSHFSLMMHVSVPRGGVESLKAALGAMEGMSVSCFEDEDPSAVEVTPKIGYSGSFSLSGADNPGIVHRLTSVLAKHGLSVDRMRTSQQEAPFGGATLFEVEGVANAPKPLSANFDPNAVREELEALGERMNCDVSLVDGK